MRKLISRLKLQTINKTVKIRKTFPKFNIQVHMHISRHAAVYSRHKLVSRDHGSAPREIVLAVDGGAASTAEEAYTVVAVMHIMIAFEGALHQRNWFFFRQVRFSFFSLFALSCFAVSVSIVSDHL